MKSSKIIAVAIALLAFLWVGSSFLFSDPTSAPPPQTEHPKQKEEKPLPEVRVRTIKASDYTDDVIVTGRSRASKKVEIRAETAGLIQELLKEEGTRVAEGDVLAKIEVRDRESRVNEAKQRVNQRQIEYNAAQNLAKEGFNSKVRVAQALADLESAKASLKDAQSDSTKTKISAPFEGTIAIQNIEAGDYVSLSDSVFTLVDLDPVEFVGYVSERRIQDITLDKETEVELLDNKIITGKVSYIAPAADPQTRTFRIIISAANEDLAIKEGLTAKIRIPASQRTAYKISPSILSLDDKGRIGVKIVDDTDTTSFIPVKILADKPDAMWIEALEDKQLPTETRFITVGQEFVGVGQKVKPVKAQGEGLL